VVIPFLSSILLLLSNLPYLSHSSGSCVKQFQGDCNVRSLTRMMHYVDAQQTLLYQVILIRFSAFQKNLWI